MKYASIIPATDWFFVHRNEDAPSAKWTVHHLAVWAVTEQDDVVGLLPVSDSSVKSGTTARLVSPPPIPGQYVHRDQLTEAMHKALEAYAK